MRPASLLFVLSALSAVLAHPFHFGEEESTYLLRRIQEAHKRTEHASEFELLSEGNQRFRQNTDPNLLKQLTADGQKPPFMFIGCSDSRVSEGTVFNAKPGTLFTERNIANQFQTTDTNTYAVLSYAVSELGVKHIIVMGHYGCGGVAAAIATPPTGEVGAADGAVQNWIDPIREIYRSSSRPEIVALREKNKGLAEVKEPEPQDPGFRALVEENIKTNVQRIATSSVIASHYALLSTSNSNEGNSTAKRSDHLNEPAADVFIHGWVYDIENGQIQDLGISVGPPGKPIPPSPFPVVQGANSKPSVNVATSSESIRARCEGMCKSRRFFPSRLSA